MTVATMEGLELKKPLTPSASFTLKTVQQTIHELNTDLDKGLADADIEFRRKRYGMYVCY
jgi:hypothetical protein